VLLLHNECLNETLFVSLPQARSVLDAWRADYNEVRPHSALANRTPEEFRAPHIAVAANAGNGQNFSPGSPHDWKEVGSQVNREKPGIQGPGQPPAIHQRSSQRKLTEKLGAERNTLSRAIHSLSASGLVAMAATRTGTVLKLDA
jgi:Integrase core domain